MVTSSRSANTGKQMREKQRSQQIGDRNRLHSFFTKRLNIPPSRVKMEIQAFLRMGYLENRWGNYALTTKFFDAMYPEPTVGESPTAGLNANVEPANEVEKSESLQSIGKEIAQ